MIKVAHLYKITNTVTGEYYIGKHNGWTQNGYWGSGNRIQRLIKKYGTDNFKYDILVISDVDYIFELERKMVTVNLIESDEKCLNLRVGGEGFTEHTKSTKLKLSKIKKLQMQDPIEKKKISDGVKKYFAENPKVLEIISNTHKGKKHSEETKLKMSIAGKLSYINNPERRENQKISNLGRKSSEETKQKISLANTGKIRTDEAKQKLREARAKQIMPEGMYERTSKIMSSLIWMNDGTRSYRVKPENVQVSKEKGMVEGRLINYINTEYKEKLKNTTTKLWQKVKETGHTGNLIKVN